MTASSETQQIARYFGGRLRVLRLSLGYESAAAFARAMGFPPGTYRPFERGERTQTAATTSLALRVKERTGVTLDWLFMGKRPPRHSRARSAKVAIFPR